jgi:hypothetical protein
LNRRFIRDVLDKQQERLSRERLRRTRRRTRCSMMDMGYEFCEAGWYGR